MRVERQTIDLSPYPDLVVVYLGMRVNRLTGLRRLAGLGPQIQKSWKAQPDGLLQHEDVIWSLRPPHVGMRQYWRDRESLEAWTRSEPHRQWWKEFLKDSGGTGFWHEAYHLRGGFEAIYDDVPKPLGLASFAAVQPARGGMFQAGQRLRQSQRPDADGSPSTGAAPGDQPEPVGPAPVITEHDYYGDH